jgi:hypothetical protein
MLTNIDNYSNIYIGPYEKASKHIHIFSKLNFNNITILTDPFGSSKLRFQYPEMFLYSIVKNNNDYELIIKRHDKANCKLTSKFFWTNGWKFDLYITIIKDHPYNSFYTKEEIITRLPKNYGEVNITNVPYYKPIIGIIIPIFGRPGYTEKCLESLKNTNLQNCVIILLDESMTKKINNKKRRTSEYVQKYDIPGKFIIKIKKNKHGNMFDSILRGFDLAYSMVDYLVTVDSDTIQNKNWITKQIELHKKISIKHPNKPIIISGFNTVNTGLHKIKKEYDDYYTKHSVGGCQLLFKKDIYLKFLRFSLLSYKWDTLFSNIINRENGIIATTKPSTINHIGKISSVRNNSSVYDFAIDYK